jgi:hypothetical protein
MQVGKLKDSHLKKYEVRATKLEVESILLIRTPQEVRGTKLEVESRLLIRHFALLTSHF